MTTRTLTGVEHHVLICNGGSCMKKGGDEVTLAIRDEIAKLGADAKVHTTRTRCNGRCEDACTVIVYPEGIWYQKMTPELGRALVNQHLLQGNVLGQQVTHTYEKGMFSNCLADAVK